MNPHRGSESRFESPFPPEECRQKISRLVDSPMALFGTRPLIGSVKDKKIRVRIRIRYGNSFQTHFRGRILPNEEGSVIVGKFSMDPLAVRFKAFWFGGVVLFGAPIFLVTLYRLMRDISQTSEDLWMGLLLPPGMGAFGLAMIGAGRFLARHEKAEITSFITSATQGKLIEKEAGQ